MDWDAIDREQLAEGKPDAKGRARVPDYVMDCECADCGTVRRVLGLRKPGESGPPPGQ